MRKEKLFIYVAWQGERNVSAYQTDKQLEWAKSHPDQDAPFSTKENIIPDGERVIFYKEKHALAHKSKMKEYLGMIEIDPGNIEERKILDMRASEIRALNLSKVEPNKDINRVVTQGGKTYLWKDYFKGLQ